MGSTRRSYTDEHKAQAVGFVLEEHRPIAEVARNIGVHEMTLGKWVEKAREDGRQPADKPLTEVERDLRPTKTQLKVSGCHRSETSARAWLRIRGYISTVRKNGDHVLTALHDAITGNPWTPPISVT